MRSIKLIDKPLHQDMAVAAMDEPGPGGANHHYRIKADTGATGFTVDLDFQKGPVNEVGVNGISDEALLAILIDRAKSFSKGPFASAEGTLALRKMQEALSWLRIRYEDRAERGVEGYNKL